MKSVELIKMDAWPQPSSNSEVLVYANESALFVRYSAENDQVALINFPLASIFKFGSPNDEALGGHPLAKSGLKYYSIYQVKNSAWIEELEKQNSVHPAHDKSRFLADKSHYIFTFQDSTLECVVNEGKFWAPVVFVFSSESEARQKWLGFIHA